MKQVTVHYLHMLNAADHNAKEIPAGFSIQEARVKQYQVNRMLYELIGAQWQWFDKLVWTNEQWLEYAEADSLRTWIAYHEGSIAGYFELQYIAPGIRQISYFGLADKFIGLGFGGGLLSEAINQCWAWSDESGDVDKVIVNTCTLDHKHALKNYQARGFSIYKEKTGLVRVPQ